MGKRYGLAASVTAGVVCLFLIFAGNSRMEKTAEQQETTQAPVLTATPSEPVEEYSLTKEQRELLDGVYECMKQTDYTGAARILNDNEQEFKDLYFTVMEGSPYYYDGTQASKKSEGGRVICFKAYATVFLGEFGENGLEGQGAALQAIRLDYPRYDYSVGTWNDGQLGGSGIIGYLYYDGIEGEEAREIKKEGTFKNGLMDGEVTYTSVSSSGTETVWKLAAKNGVTVMDERWVHDPDKGEYHLTSETDAGRIYMLGEGDLETVLWKNMINW